MVEIDATQIPDILLSGFGDTIGSMNRTERLYALVEELRARAPRTMRAVDLANRFEVSARTVERDLLALQEAGVPIWAQPGPRGGYGLNVDTTLPPLNFTPAEAVAIATSLAAAHSMPFAEAGQSALGKIAAAMATTSKETAMRLASQVRVVPGPGEAARNASMIVERALLDSVAIALHYRDAQDRESERIVEPAGIFGTGRGWYLAAWCRLRQGPRAFRFDRILDARLTSEAITPRALDTVIADLPHLLIEPALP